MAKTARFQSRGSTPGQGTRSQQDTTKSLHAAAKDSTCHNEDGRAHVLHQGLSAAK